MDRFGNRPRAERSRRCRNRDCRRTFTPSRFDLNKTLCRGCQTRKRKEKSARKMRSRQRPARRPKIRGWAKKREPALFGSCAVCGRRLADPTDKESRLPPQVIDHIIPAAMIAHLKIEKDPEDPRNLMDLCPGDHSRKAMVEDYLWKGYFLVGWQLLLRWGWPMKRVREAWEFYGFSIPTAE